MSTSYRLSICIPVYNTLVDTFINELALQANRATAPVELVVLDDHSEPNFAQSNQSLDSVCRYVYLPENVGRSRIRNLFLEYTTGEYLLFIDGDSAIIDPDFIQKYLDFLDQCSPEVVVGASIYQSEKPDREHLLRWKYSRERESKNANERSKLTGSFKTNNFIIKRSIFSLIKFNDALIGYGHEDTLFGLDLERNKIKINHIENPVLNRHLDSNHLFLIKTENAIRNLSWLYKHPNYSNQIQAIKLIQAFSKLQKWGLITVYRMLFWFSAPLCFWTLKKGYVHLKIFDFYKLGLFIRKIKS